MVSDAVMSVKVSQIGVRRQLVMLAGCRAAVCGRSIAIEYLREYLQSYMVSYNAITLVPSDPSVDSVYCPFFN